MHERIAAEVKRKLEAKGQSTEGVKTFEAFYEMLRVEAASLQREYQFRYCRKKGLILRWSYFVSPSGLVNRVQVDKADSLSRTKFGRDVDVRVRIAPNATEVISEIGFQEVSSNGENEDVAIMLFNDIVEQNKTAYWQSTRFADILSRKGRNQDISVIQDTALVDLYDQIAKEFKDEVTKWDEIPSSHTFQFDLRGSNPSRKLLYLLNGRGMVCANTTLTYIGGETVVDVNELKEHIVSLSRTAIFKPASSYRKYVRGNNNDQRKQNSENGGAGQYFHELNDGDIEELERDAIKNSIVQEFREREGNPTINDNQYYFLYSAGVDVGYVNGEETDQLSVEITSANTRPEVHSHPR